MRQADIIAASVVLGFFCLVTTMVLVARFLWNRGRIHGHARGKDNDVEAQIAEYGGDGEAPPVNEPALIFTRSWKEKLAPRRKSDTGQVVPSLAAFIKAGDEGVYSSTLFSGLHTGQQHQLGDTISLDLLYDALADTMKKRPAAERLAYSRAMSQFLASRKTGLKRSQSLMMGREDRAEGDRRRKYRTSFEFGERSARKSRPRKMVQAPSLVSIQNPLASPLAAPLAEGGMGDGVVQRTSWAVQHARYSEGGTGIMVSSGELAALSIVLGSPLSVGPSQNLTKEQSTPTMLSEKGAFGISIQSVLATDGTHQISLKRHALQLSEQLPSLSSDQSILFTKHLACGSLPLSQDTFNTNCILITPATAESIIAGTPLQFQQHDETIESTASARFLSALPHSRTPSLYTLTPTPSTPPSGAPVPPQLPENLLTALSILPFITLPPLASTPLISTIRFVTSAGLPPGRLLQRLESLIEKVHRHSPHLGLFGPLYEASNAGALFREQERLGRLAAPGRSDRSGGGSGSGGYAGEETLAQKTARLHRYGVLVERLMALLVEDGLDKDELQKTMMDATRLELEKSYADAVTASRNPTSTTPTPPTPSPGASPNSHSNPTSNSASSPPAPTNRSSPPHPPITGTGTSNPTLTLNNNKSNRSGADSPLSRHSNSTRRSGAFSNPNLGSQVENILKAPLPLGVEQVAFVARMVVIGWCLSAGGVAWGDGDGEEGVRFEVLGEGDGGGGMVMS